MADNNKNHLFIGLGGTGGKVLKELRKRVFEEFGSNDTPNEIVCVDYIYVDSSESDLNDRTGWKVLGKSVHLAEAQKVSIHGIDGDMLNNLNQYPGIQSFLPVDEAKKVTAKIGPLIEQGIGGQRRRLGRLLLANNLSSTSDNKDFVSRLKQTVKRLTETSGEQMVTFHICAGLAGGTGSGSIVDIVAQIRKHYPPKQGNITYKINLYLYLPEMVVVNQGHDQGFYQANGYAALSELNAISVNMYLPYDISGEKDIFSGEVQRLLADMNPFDAAFVYSDVNEVGKKLEISHDLPAAVADFLFQHTVASLLVGSNGQMSRLIGCENDGAAPENDKANQATRSRKFLSFGIKRVEYPENEIKEYATYRFAQQAARQLTFNKWDSTGYIELTEEEVGAGFASEIKENRTREQLKLSNSYLMLVKPLDSENKSARHWKDITETWESRTQGFADDVMTDEEKRSWLAAFNEKCEDYFVNQYRSHGVKKFYEVQRQERTNYARMIRRHIEKKLFDEWAAGTKSILEVSKYLSLLITDCNSRIDAFKQQTSRIESEVIDINETIHDINEDWAGISWALDPVTKKSRKILERFRDAKCELYAAYTRIEGYNYAQELLQSVIKELGIAKQGVEIFKSNLTNILDEVGKQADSRCQIGNANDESRTIKKYNPETVQELVKGYITTEEMQRDNALAIRNEMLKALGDDGERTFANLGDKTDYDTTVGIILDQCSVKAEAAMENSAKTDIVFKMVRVNILEKLKQELNTDEKREEFVKKIVASASSFVQFNQSEMSKANVGNGGNTQSMVQLCIPRYEDDTTGFREQLIKAFVLACPGFDPKQDVAENYKQNQIVVVTAKSGFPLRHLSNLTALKQKYDQLLAGPDKELNKLLLHSESFEEGFLPTLYELDNKSLKAMVIRPVMLAYAMGLIKKGEDPVTQEKFDVINLPSSELEVLGVENLVPLGKNVLDTIDVLANDYDKAKKVIEKEKMQFARCRSNSQRAELRKALGEVLAKIKACPECENNQYNPTYQKYQAIAVDLVKNDLQDK